MYRKEQEPIEVESYRNDGKRYEHPAFAMISASHFSGGHTRLFGSDLIHKGGVSIRIKTAVLERSLSHDWTYEQDPIVEVVLSEAQWAKFVSSMNSSGTPATLTQCRQGEIETVPSIAQPSLSKKEVHQDEMKRSVEKFLESLQSSILDLENLADGKSISKKDLRGIIDTLKIRTENLPLNMEYAVKTFSEITETLSEYAKIEIDAYLTQSDAVKQLTKEDDEK